MHKRSPGPRRRGNSTRGAAEPAVAAHRRLHLAGRAPRTVDTGSRGDGLQRAICDIRPQRASAEVRQQQDLRHEAAAPPISKRREGRQCRIDT